MENNNINTNTVNTINWSADLTLDPNNLDNIFAPDVRATTTERPVDGTPVTLKVGDRAYPASWVIVDRDGLYLQVKDPDLGIMVIPPTHPEPDTRYKMLTEESSFLWELLTVSERKERSRRMEERAKEQARIWREQYEREIAARAAEIFEENCAAARGVETLEKLFTEACHKLAVAEAAYDLWGDLEYNWGHMEHLSGLCARLSYEKAKKEFNELLEQRREELLFLAEPIRAQTDRDCWGPMCPGCSWAGHATKPCAACGRA